MTVGIATRLGATVAVPDQVFVKAGPLQSESFLNVMRAHGLLIDAERGGWFQEVGNRATFAREFTFGGPADMVRDAIGDAVVFIRRWS